MNFEEWWDKSGAAETLLMGQKYAAQVAWNFSEKVEREACAKVCLSREDKKQPPEICWQEKTDGQCCCNCRWHIEDFDHCTTVADRTTCVCSRHKGWICMMPEIGRAHSGWSAHGMCECHEMQVSNAGVTSLPHTKGD